MFFLGRLLPVLELLNQGKQALASFVVYHTVFKSCLF